MHERAPHLGGRSRIECPRVRTSLPARLPRLVGLTAAYIALSAALSGPAPAAAAVPLTMSYQGLLTDNAGTPVADGPYDLTFRIYAVPSGGAALWSETQTAVSVSRGEFSVILGSSTPLSLGFGSKRWLGVSVGLAAELVPRVELAASPYALSLRLPFAAPDSSVGMSDGPYPYFALGGGVYSPPANFAHLVMVSDSLLGGEIVSFAPGALDLVRLGYSTSTPGGQVIVRSLVNVNSAVTIRGDRNGKGPYLSMVGDSGFVSLNTDQTGDASVRLPDNSISSTELLNEPGISQGKVNGAVLVSDNGAMHDIVSTTITIPAAGYIVVDASSGARFSGSAGPGNSNIIGYQIDETAGGGTDPDQQREVGLSEPPSTALFSQTATARRTYFKSSGTYEFRLEAVKGGVGISSLVNPVITATYYPTSYGSVVSSATTGPQSGSDRGFASMGAGPGNAGSVVDLRDLELQALRTRAAADRAQEELDRAEARREERGSPIRSMPVIPRAVSGGSR